MDTLTKQQLIEAFRAWRAASDRVGPVSAAAKEANARMAQVLHEVARCRDVIFDRLTQCAPGAEAHFMVDGRFYRVVATRMTDELPARIYEIAYSVLDEDQMAPLLDVMKSGDSGIE